MAGRGTDGGIRVRYLDSKGNEISVGAKVLCAEDEPPGEVVAIIDPDGDWSDELQRNVALGPYIVVKWPEFDEPERMHCSQRLTWRDYPHGSDAYYCEDIDVVA